MRVKNISRYRKVMELRNQGKTFEQIGKELKITRQRVFQIYQRASKKLPSKQSPILKIRQVAA